MATTLQRYRARAFDRQQGSCFYCGLPIWLLDAQQFAQRYRLTQRQIGAFRCTAEHLRARCDGGTDTAVNVVAACQHCNSTRHRRKHAATPDRWRTIQNRRSWARWTKLRASTHRIQL